jgi:glycosyltransferase involved in cell wall biosynthesis
MLDLLQRVGRAWGIETPPSGDDVFRSIKAWLESPVASDSAQSVRFRGTSTFDLIKREMVLPLRDLLRATTRLRNWIKEDRSGLDVYLHTSHTQLNYESRFAWLKRNNVRSCFFIHDVIPIDYPEFCSPGALARHLARLETVSKIASMILVNSDFTARRLKEFLAMQGLRIPEIVRIPLGVDKWFLSRDRLEPPSANGPYFLCIGTIEPRKNLNFLLAVWRRLVERLGARAPRLVLAGRRGWENENVIDILDRSRTLGPYLAEVSGLTDAGLASLIAGATAVVAPSLVEGFDLPLVESLAAGTPVLASDIGAHREVGGAFVDYLDPIDGRAWTNALDTFCMPNSPARAAAAARVKAYRPVTWHDHVARALQLLEHLPEP